MPGQRDPRKKPVTMFVTPTEKLIIKQLVEDLGESDMTALFRRLIHEASESSRVHERPEPYIVKKKKKAAKKRKKS